MTDFVSLAHRVLKHFARPQALSRNRRELPLVESLEPRQLMSWAPTAGRSTAAHAKTPHAPAALSIAKLETNASLDSVTFGGEGFHAITSDVITDFPTYRTEQWLGDRDPHRWPVLYAASSKLTVSAEWLEPKSASVTGEILARATTSNGLTISPTPVRKEDGKLILPPVHAPSGGPNLRAAAATAAFGDDAQFYPHFVIEWQLSFDGGKSWSDAGQSDNPLYVSSSTHPLPDAKSREFYLTVVDSAINQTLGLTAGNQAAIVSNTWSLFTGRAIRQFSRSTPFSDGTEHGRALTYYGTPASASDPTRQQVESFGYTLNFTVRQLLQDGDAQCTAWAELFLDMLLVNGIFEKNDLVTVNPQDSRGFLVNNWTFEGAGTNRNRDYPYLDAPGKHFDVLKQPGLAGQNSSDPLSVFTNHVIAEINKTYYDPSYGKTYANFRQMTDEDVAGFMNIVDHDARIVEIQKLSPSGQRLKLYDFETWKPTGAS